VKYNFIILWFIFIEAISSKCRIFDASKDGLTFECSDVIAYEFYVANSSSLLILNEQLKILLNNTRLILFSNECLASYKKIVCSKTYLRCNSAYQLNNVIHN
jgi:hypothetical protein